MSHQNWTWIGALLIGLLVQTAAHGRSDNEIDPVNCKVNMQNLDEVVVAQLAGKIDGFCYSMAAQNKYFPIGIPTPPHRLQIQHTPKGENVYLYANYYYRERKLIGSMKEPDLDGKPSRSYQFKMLVTLMKIDKTNHYKPLCQIVDAKFRYVKEPWGWFLSEDTRPPGPSVQFLLSQLDASVAAGKTSISEATRIKRLESQCNKSI
jgi:hypothetical protein